MNKKILVIALLIVAVVIIGRFFYVKKSGMGKQNENIVKEETQTQPEKNASPDVLVVSTTINPQFNFNYSNGEQPWKLGRIRQNPPEAKIYFPIWKEVFKKFNSMSDEYFNSHIFVVEIFADKFKENGKEEKRFSVIYYYHIGWAQVKLQDVFTYGFEDVGEGITAGELLHDLKSLPLETKYPQSFSAYFAEIKSIDSIATKEQVEKAVRATSPFLSLDVNSGMELYRGQLAISLDGTVDEKENKCLESEIILETAQVLEVRNVPCMLE